MGPAPRGLHVLPPWPPSGGCRLAARGRWPEVPSALRASLLSLGAAGEATRGSPCPARRVDPGRRPSDGSREAVRRRPCCAPVPRRPAGPPPIPVVDRTAPALHRSAVWATVFAGLAAGASAAAAWSFAVVGTPLAPPASPRCARARQCSRPTVGSCVHGGIPGRPDPGCRIGPCPRECGVGRLAADHRGPEYRTRPGRPAPAFGTIDAMTERHDPSPEQPAEGEPGLRSENDDQGTGSQRRGAGRS